MKQNNILKYLFDNTIIYYKPYEYYIPKGTKWGDVEDLDDDFSFVD